MVTIIYCLSNINIIYHYLRIREKKYSIQFINTALKPIYIIFEKGKKIIYVLSEFEPNLLILFAKMNKGNQLSDMLPSCGGKIVPIFHPEPELVTYLETNVHLFQYPPSSKIDHKCIT